jgi:hypothetical protein
MKNYLLLFFLCSAVIMSGCDDDDDDNTPPPNPGPSNTKNLTLNITGLKDLGSSAQYEGWLIVNNNPVSTGKFTVNQNGVLSKTVFAVDSNSVNNATAFVLTIEPVPDNSPIPHDRHILAGEFSTNTATITTAHGEALGADQTNASGSFILATPTDGGMTSNELSGVWFLNPGTPTPGDETAALSLPALPAGWIYEGWAVINGIPVTTGKFSEVDMADQAAPFSGPMAGPPFPGEDFLQNAPTGLTFPTNLQSDTIVVTIEPVPDTEDDPFFLAPLKAGLPSNAADHTPYQLNNVAAMTMPSGTATR